MSANGHQAITGVGLDIPWPDEPLDVDAHHVGEWTPNSNGLAPDPNGSRDPEVDADPPKLASQLLTRTALKQLPDPEPLIDNVLDRGTVSLLYGGWGTCKSF